VDPGIERLLRSIGLDPSEWIAASVKAATWTTPVSKDGGVEVVENTYISASLVPHPNFWLEMVEELKARGYTLPKDLPRRLRPAKGGFLVIAPSDPHIGVLPADGDGDMAHQVEEYLTAVSAILEMAAPYAPQKAALLILGDHFHIDTPASTTTAGTRVETLRGYRDVVRAGVEAIVKAARLVARAVPGAEVWIVPGNHDEATAYAVGVALQTAADIPVIVPSTPRSYTLIGDTLIGITHGNTGFKREGDLAAIMAIEAPDLWRAAKRREWLLGHLHRRSTSSHYAVYDGIGVRIRRLPSLAAEDNWHRKRGFVGRRREAIGIMYFSSGVIELVWDADAHHSVAAKRKHRRSPHGAGALRSP